VIHRRAVRRSIGALVVSAAVTLGCSPDEMPSTTQVRSIAAPSEIVAGAPIVVVVESDGVGEVRLDVVDAFVTTTLTAIRAHGAAGDETSFEVPAALTRSSGITTFRAVGAVGDDVMTSTVIIPDAPTDPLDVLVGPRTIVADGADETMAIGFVTDRFGNPLLDGFPVQLTLLEELGAIIDLDVVMEGGLAAQVVGSGTIAQRVEVFASVDGGELSSRRVDYNEVPGPASLFDVRVPFKDDRTTAFVADGRTLLSIVTGEIDDRFGNRLPDGHLIRLQTDGPDGIGQLTARTIDGIARFELVAPRLPGVVEVSATADGTSSDTIEIEFVPAVSEIPVESVRNEDVLTVSIGPVLDQVGAVVVDGTPVSVAVSGVGADAVELELIDGRASVAFESNERVSVGRIDVEVLGVNADEELS